MLPACRLSTVSCHASVRELRAQPAAARTTKPESSSSGSCSRSKKKVFSGICSFCRPGGAVSCCVRQAEHLSAAEPCLIVLNEVRQQELPSVVGGDQGVHPNTWFWGQHHGTAKRAGCSCQGQPQEPTERACAPAGLTALACGEHCVNKQAVLDSEAARALLSNAVPDAPARKPIERLDSLTAFTVL